MKETLGDKVEKVVVSSRLQQSPCCLVTGEFGWSANMERIMKAQALKDAGSQAHMMCRKTLEVNPENPIIMNLLEKVGKEVVDPTVKDIVWMLYETSIINGGFSLEEPSKFTSRIHKLIGLGLSLEESELELEAEAEVEAEVELEADSTMEEVD